MTKLIATERFLNESKAVYSPKVASRIEEALLTIQTIPESGSTNVPESIRARFGSRIRKYVVAPFDIIYEYNKETDAAVILSIIHHRQAK